MSKKLIVTSLLSILLLTIAFSFVGDIFPQNNPGLFIQLTNIGYSWENSEIKTMPIPDLLGIYNLAYRNYVGKNIVTQIGISYYDMNKLLFLNEEETDNMKFAFWSIDLYNHSNFFIGNFSLKPQVNVSAIGFNEHSTSSATNFNVYSFYAKGGLQGGYYLANDKEVFLYFESGKVFSVDTNPKIIDSEYEEIVNKIKSDSLYILTKIGIKWYYSPYSIFEIGYRFSIIKSIFPLQGYGLSDIFYGYNTYLVNYTEGNEAEIPWVTTNYYLNFSTAF